MKTIVFGLAFFSLCQTAWTGEIASVYTDLDSEKGCTTFAAADEGDGDWANLVCTGYSGYPVIIYSAGLRESVFYGFPPAGDLAPAWESFAAFNSAGPKIKWRVEMDGDRALPFATIHRWFVSDHDDAEKKTEVLVVTKVGQIAERDGCVVGLVVATGNPKAQRNSAQDRRRAGAKFRLRRRRARAGQRRRAAAGVQPRRELIRSRSNGIGPGSIC